MDARPPRPTPRPAHRGDAPLFEHVSSTANDTVKLLRSLDRKKARQESGLFLAEGARLCEEALQHGWLPAYALAGAEALKRPAVDSVLKRMKGAGARVLTASEKVLSAVARKDNPQTVVAAFRQRLSTLDDLGVDGPRRWIALYETRDPGNLGTIIRTADAAGVDGVILLGQTCDPFSVETVRATMGSLFAMPLVATSFDAFDDWRRRTGARMVAASMHGQVRHDGARYDERSVILMGTEQSGLPKEIEAACDELVRIPMKGAADSLNLASAASIMIYEAWRARGYEGANR